MWQPNYITTERLASYMRTDPDASAAELAVVVGSASRAADKSTNRQFGQSAPLEPRFYTPRWSHKRGCWFVDVDDFMDSTGIAVAVDTVGDGSFTGVAAPVKLWPYNAAAKRRPWTRIDIVATGTVQPCGGAGEVRVTPAYWGWDEVPEPIELATLLQANRFANRADAPFGIAGSPSDGSEMRLLARLDPDLLMSVSDYVRKVWAQ